MTITVFSYGSNMHRARLECRVGRCKWLEPAWISSHQFRFHKRGKDNSAKADAFYTGHSEDRVWGALAVLNERSKHLLDQFEGLGKGYCEKLVEATLSDGSRARAKVYVAMEDHITTGLRPFDWYQRFVIAGAWEHTLPQSYIKFLGSHPSIPDPDATRDKRNQRILYGTD